MGAMFIGQQFLQNVLDYSTLEAGTAIIPAAMMMALASRCADRAPPITRPQRSRPVSRPAR